MGIQDRDYYREGPSFLARLAGGGALRWGFEANTHPRREPHDVVLGGRHALGAPLAIVGGIHVVVPGVGLMLARSSFRSGHAR